MPISISTIVVGTQLVVAVADKVPAFDIARSCKFNSAATTGPSVDQSLKNCVNEENGARQELVSGWSKFSASSKAQCIPLEGIGGDPSYVHLFDLPANEFVGPMTSMFGNLPATSYEFSRVMDFG